MLQCSLIAFVFDITSSPGRVGEEILDSKVSIVVELLLHKQNINYKQKQMKIIHTLLITNEM